MTELLLELSSILMTFFATHAVVLFPMWKSRNLRMRTVFIIYCCITLYLCIGFLIVKQFMIVDFRVLQLYMVMAIPLLLTQFIVFRKRALQNTFLISISLMYGPIHNGTGMYAGQNWFLSAMHPLLITNTVTLAVIALTLPPLLLTLKQLFNYMEIGQTKVWRTIWLLPTSFFVLFLLTSNPIDAESFQGSVFLIFRVIIYFAMLLTCYLLKTSLQQAKEAQAAKREAEELSGKNQFLESLSNMKSEYLSNLGHEMKTPLTVLSLNLRRAARLSAESGDAEKTQKAHATAIGETERLIRMTEAALNLASMQESRGRMDDIDMAGLLVNYAESYRPLLEKNGNALTTNIQENMPLIIGTPDLLAQVISNLLSNANAHTKNGEVTITADTNSGVMTITVADNGEGVDEKVMPRVFMRGVSGRGSTGLGLSLCKNIVESHGGLIEIKSEHGQGTAVTFTLPIYPDKEGPTDG